MATEYGYQRPNGTPVWASSYDQAAHIVKTFPLANYSLVAREVSEPRIVSIRA